MKCFVVNGWGTYHTLMQECGLELVDSLKQADVILFTGGEDINPALYDEKPWPETGRPNLLRDAHEKHIFNECKELEIPMIGICRGAQFLCAMAGGKLVQHVDNHGGPHQLLVNATGEQFPVTSTHHQMMMPGDFGDILAVRPDGQWFEVDPEVVWFPSIRSLGFQFHPEFMPKDSEGRKYFISTVKKFIMEE